MQWNSNSNDAPGAPTDRAHIVYALTEPLHGTERNWYPAALKSTHLHTPHQPLSGLFEVFEGRHVDVEVDAGRTSLG